MTNEEILKNPNLFWVITEKEFDKTIVGEDKARKDLFLGMNMINVKNSKNKKKVIIGGGSSAGKEHTMKQVMNIFPKNKFVYRTRISPKALTYWHANEKDWNWNDYNLCLTDIGDDVLNSDVFKVFTSDGSEATIADKGKAVDLKVNGKPNVFVTTAEADPNNQILTRFDLISLDESESQTEKIMEFQAREAETGEVEIYDKKIIASLSNLKKVFVIVPFAGKMIKYFPQDVKMRRVFNSFLDYIKSSCALYQYQREQDNKGRFIATKQDYEIAREVIEDIREQTISGKTTRETKYLKKFEELIEKSDVKWFSVSEIHNNTKYKSLPTWWDVMKRLEEKGLVEGQEFEDLFKPVRKFTLKEKTNEEQLKLPKFEDLK